MKVNFNNLRKKAVLTLQDLTKDLNRGIIKETQYAKPNDVTHGQKFDIKGYVLVDAESIEKKMNSIIGLVNSIAGVHEEGNEDFKDLSDELSKNIVWFNNK